jgi:DNA-directed RNA polymerase subunit RPC12/RpoP
MILIHKDVSSHEATKPVECPVCGAKRAFDVPRQARVRTARRGKPPPGADSDMAFVKCKNCKCQIGISMETEYE